MSMLFAVVATTLVVSAVCSLFEATLYSTRLATLEAAKGGRRHKRAAVLFLNMKKSVGGPTAAILILNTIANTAGATVAGMLAGRTFGTSYVVVFSAVLTMAILLFSEIVPKTYGAVHWRSLWPYVAWPLAATQKVMKPLVWLTQQFSNLLVPNRSASLTTKGEVLAMIEMSAQSGQLTSIARELLTSVFHFDEIVCRQIMVPRNEVDVFEKGWPLDRCLEVAQRTRHTRYPLCDGSFDAPIGIVHVKELLGVDSTVPIDSVARPARNVPETMRIPDLLREMQDTQEHMAIVVDEHGSPVGIVTMENLVEEIVGSVQDEFDDEQPEIVQGESGTYVVDGTALILRVNRQLSVQLPHSRGVDTLSGLLVREFGRFLKVGDKTDLQGVGVEVIEVADHRATKIRLTVPEQPDEESGS